MQTTLEDTQTSLSSLMSWLDTCSRIFKMSLEELPEFLVHEDWTIRKQARSRMLELKIKEEKI